MISSPQEILSRPGSITFPANQPYLRDFTGSGGRLVRQPSGHLVFYDRHGRRVLATDPDGTPLHECEWIVDRDGSVRLTRARIHLDWGQWVGITSGGMVNETTLDLSKKAGWQQIRSDDLRRLAAQSLGVPLEEVRFFYTDDDLIINTTGQATIRHRKDAFYVLEDGTFEKARFMACMGAMHWARIDFLPVVELFQSLLPGTGSATMELIRALYDDQNPTGPLSLRYRGIPTYPSEAAYRLFGAFFVPQHPSGGDPFPIFMDAPRSHEVTWLPAPGPPQRHFDPERKLCVTVHRGAIQKVTVRDDPAALPFLSPWKNGFSPCDRRATVRNGILTLNDGEVRTDVALRSTWGVMRDTPETTHPTYPVGWRSLFRDAPPQPEPTEAFGAVLLYPADETEISEVASYPFVADHLQDCIEQQPEVGNLVARAERVLIDHWDGAITTCVALDRPRDYTVLYTRPAFAQKHAQTIWNQLATAGHLEWARRITFVRKATQQQTVYAKQYELIYQWVGVERFNHRAKLVETVRLLEGALAPRGLAFVVGPPALGPLLGSHRFRVIRTEPVETLPSFRMHRTILPKARLKAGLTLFHVLRG
jgi:hypothetical protein